MIHDQDSRKVPGFFSTLFSNIAYKLESLYTGGDDSKYTSIFAPSENSDHTFITNNLGLISYFLVPGAGSARTPAIDEKSKDFFVRSLSAYLQDGHMLIDSFTSHSGNIESYVNKMLDERVPIAERNGVDVRPKHSSIYQKLKMGNFEFRIVALYTPPDIKNIHSVEDFIQGAPPFIAKKYQPAVSNSRSDALLNRHHDFVKSYIEYNKESLIDASLLKHDEALLELYEYIHPKSANLFLNSISKNREELRPLDLTGDRNIDGFAELAGIDIPNFLLPDRPVECPKIKGHVLLDGMRFTTVKVETLMRSIPSFASLHQQLITKGIPYRYKIVIGGDPVSVLRSKYDSAKLKLSKDSKSQEASSDRKDYADSYWLLKSYAKLEAVVFVSIVFSTWVDDEEDVALLKRRTQELSNLVRQWTKDGMNIVKEEKVSPVLGFYSTLPTYHETIARQQVQTASFLQSLVPEGRATMPFKKADIIAISKDHKMVPFDPHSGRQFCLNYIVGAPGRGKSVIMNKFMDKTIFDSASGELPLYYRIDKGASSEEALRTYSRVSSILRERVKYIPIQNIEHSNQGRSEHINLFDSPLGLREPIPTIVLAIKSLLVQRITGMKGDSLPDADSIISDCVNETFARFRRRSEMKRIDVMSIPSLASTLRKHNYEYNRDEFESAIMPIGFDVVEFLIHVNEINLATEVQARCTITIDDLIATASTNAFLVKYDVQKSGMNLGTSFRSQLQAFKKEFPFVSYPSTIHLSSLRYVSFELGDVLLNGEDDYTTSQNLFWFGLCFIYIRANMFVHQDHIPPATQLHEAYEDTRSENIPAENVTKQEISDSVLKHIVRKIKELQSILKFVDIDELQAYIPVSEVGETVSYAQGILGPFNNEARKWNINVTYASQYPYHAKFMAGNLTGIYILGFNGTETANTCVKYFSITQSEVDIYVNRLRLSPDKGTHAYVILRDVKEKSDGSTLTQTEYRHQLYFPVSPYELWDWSSNKRESRLRNMAYEEFTPTEAKFILIGALPKAGNSDIFAEVRELARKSGGLDEALDEDEEEDMIDELVAKKIFEKSSYYAEIGRKSVYG